MNKPPVIPRVLLRLCLPPHLYEVIAGDLEEQWAGSGHRARPYWSAALRSIADCWRDRLPSGRGDRDGVSPFRGAHRRSSGDGVVASLVQDTRFAVRMMLRAPAFTAAAVLTLALGIGGSTAIFSTVKPALFEPLPYPDANRIMAICDRTEDRACIDVTFGTYREVLERNRSFDTLSVIRTWQPVLAGTGQAERLEGLRVSAAYFDVLGTRPVLGRGFTEADDRPGAPRVVMLGDGLWRRRFGAEPSVIGRDIALGSLRYTVIGVLPRTFDDVLSPRADVWTPLQYDPSLPVDGREWGHHLRMIGRLKPAVRAEAAAADLDAIARAPLPGFPRVAWAALNNGFDATVLQENLTRGVRPVLFAFAAAVTLVLVIASANVANLLLARALHRRREFAMRAALGASRGRLTRQLLTEGLLISLCGGVLGVVGAQVGVDALVALAPPGLPRLEAIAVDGAALVFALVVTVLVGLSIALIPAFHTFRGDLQRSLQQNTRTAAGGHHTARQTLVVAEVALALVLLVSAGLLFRSLTGLIAIAPGFDPNQLAVAQVQTVGAGFQDIAVSDRFFQQVVERVRAIPGVSAAAVTSQLPLSGDVQGFGVHTEYAPQVYADLDRSAFRYAVSPGYFETMGIPLRRGRLLDHRDRADAPRVVVISDTLARRRFAGVDPIGQRLRIGPNDSPWFTVVGIVGDVKQVSLSIDGDEDAVYVTPSQWHFADPAMWIVARSAVEDGLPASIRAAVSTADTNQPVVRMTSMSALLDETTADRRFALLVFGVFGGVALVLSVTGLYGALARSVNERTREIGVRSALGASRGEIVSMVLRQGLALAVAGVTAGILGAIAVTRLLETLLFDTEPTDPLTYAATALLFMGVAAMASSVPALRAATIDPAITLRAE